MKVKIRTQGVRLFIPVPVNMVRFVIRVLPNRLFTKIEIHTPEPYCDLITKENICMILGECMDSLRDNRGLEIIRVEAMDGTFLSIKL